MKHLPVIALVALLAAQLPAADYVVLISDATNAKPEWRAVADALFKKHGPDVKVLTYTRSLWETLPALKIERPRYVAVTAQPGDLDPAFVADLHRLSRHVNPDIFGDFLWGIITGYEAADALRIATCDTPLTIKRGLNTTGVNSGLFDQNIIFSDGTKRRVETKSADGKSENTVKDETPEGLSPLFAQKWDELKPQFMCTSSHATEYNLEMPFGEGMLVCFQNRFHVLPKDHRKDFGRFMQGVQFTAGEKELAAWMEKEKLKELQPSTEPKVWLAAGNCLLGNVNRSRHSMAVTALSAGGCNQLVAYTVTTWYGEAGWGTLKLFTGSSGRLSLSESFYLNSQRLLARTRKINPKLLDVEFNGPDIEVALKSDKLFALALQNSGGDKGKATKDVIGLVHDRDVLAFYGDPKWVAKFDASKTPQPFEATWTKLPEGGYSVKLTGLTDPEWKGNFEALLPTRVDNPTVISSTEAEVVVGTHFILANDLTLKKGASIELKILPGK